MTAARKNWPFFFKSHQYEGAATVNAVHKMLEMMNNADKTEAASPLVTLPGFGKSPVGKQLRVTDSPFPLKDEFEGDSQVDKAAEEFIKRFYKDLKLQNTMAALDSPYHNEWDEIVRNGRPRCMFRGPLCLAVVNHVISAVRWWMMQWESTKYPIRAVGITGFE